MTPNEQLTEKEIKQQVAMVLKRLFSFWEALTADGLMPTHRVLCDWKVLSDAIIIFRRDVAWCDLVTRWIKK